MCNYKLSRIIILEDKRKDTLRESLNVDKIRNSCDNEFSSPAPKGSGGWGGCLQPFFEAAGEVLGVTLHILVLVTARGGVESVIE